MSSEGRGIFEEILRLRQEGATGVLEVQLQPGKRRLFFRDGEIHLGASHPLAQKLSHYLSALAAKRFPEDPAVAELREGLLSLVQRMAGVVSEWQGAGLAFVPGLVQLPADLVGPLPTLRLVMRGASVGCGAQELERKAGGGSQRWVVANTGETFQDLLGLLPEESWILERLRVPTSVEELCREAPVDRVAVLCSLVELAAVGSVVPENGAEAAGFVAPKRQRDAVVERLLERLERDLEEEPLKLDPAVHRKQLAELLGKFGGLNYYELLGLDPASASSEKIQEAYEKLGKLVHPVHATRLGWQDRSEALEVLFEQISVAYLTLIDPERRAAYNRDSLIEVAGPSRTGLEREREQQALAKDYFEKAQRYHQAGERHFAKELYYQAVRLDTRPEYWVAIGNFEAELPQTMARAIDAFRSALELDNDCVPARLGLARIFERQGDLARAKVQYAAVARLDPGNLEASSALQRIGATSSKSSGGLMHWLFRRE